MNKLQFKTWLVLNDKTQKQVAKDLELTETTISNYNRVNRFPRIFELALKGLES